MKWICKLTFKNLFRRRIRTILTILGIAIGILSLVVLIGIGKGIENQILKEFDESGSIKRIEVSGNGRNKYKSITDKRIEDFSKIPEVCNVYPVSEYEIYIDIDKYIGWFSVKGIPKEELLKLELENGSMDKLSKVKPDLILGDMIGSLLFYNDGEMSFSTDKNNRTDQLTGKKAQITFLSEQGVKDTFYIAATLKKNDSYTINSFSVYCDIDVLKRYCKKNSVNGVPLTQQAKEDGSRYNEWIYDQAIVTVDSVENVDYVVKKLQDMGFETYNEKEQLDTTKRITNIIKFMFSCIGAISLLVAIIGIGNTMTAAVYDRIGEIGMLKMLGCDLDELRFMFLFEAGIISTIGGIVGVVTSYGVNGIINKIVTIVLKFPKGTTFVNLDIKTAILAVIFALFLGMLAGFLPARWASKIMPLDAIKKVD